MPTGYTCVIDDNNGISFRAFATGCARAFGALITMRDDPSDAPIPQKFEPIPYYRESVKSATADLKEALGLTLEGAAALMASEAETTTKRNAEYRVKQVASMAAYERMRGEVEAWIPPSPEHDGVKRFMLEQLSTGDPGPVYDYDEPLALSPEAWLRKRIDDCTTNLERAAESLAKEEQRCAERTAWVQALLASLPPVTSAHAWPGCGEGET